MTPNPLYDVAIVGGGLAGLSLAIQLSRQGYAVVLFEKEHYPFHKVCGEYISLESWDFLVNLGLPLTQLQLPIIKQLQVSAPDGNLLEHALPLGGFGISRYLLDNSLKEIALKEGVALHEGCKVENVSFAADRFTITSRLGVFTSKVCCGSYGKRSNLDLQLKRPFAMAMPNKLNHYIGVKYHISTEFPADTIALHNFKNGYCGISRIENGRYCLCYLTNAANLKNNHNSIAEMEKNVLYKNKYLEEIFRNCSRLYAAPVTISQVSFAKKSQVENHLLLLGDAAGMITPLCGNGMSMALHGSKIAAMAINEFLQERQTRAGFENQYAKTWQQQFNRRLTTGRLVQQAFGREWVTNRFINLMKHLPGLTTLLIRQTHGQPF